MSESFSGSREAFYFKNIKNIIDKLFVILYNIHVAVSDVT